MTSKKTEHTTPDGITFKVGDTIVEVDRVGNPFVETLGTVEGFTKTLMKVVRTNRDRVSYSLKMVYGAPDVGDLRILSGNHRYLLKTGMSERGNYSIIHGETVRLLEKAHRLMHNQSSASGTKAPDPVEAYKLLKQAQSQLNKAIAGIEKEVVDD